MTRPLGAEWSVLDRNTDPIPGDTAVIDEIRTAYEQLASVTQEAHDLLISGSRIDGGQGAAMEAFRELIGAVPKRLQGMATSYREAARALQTFEPALTEAQAMSLRALEQAREAVAAQASTAAALAGAEAAADAAGKATGDAAPDPAKVDEAKADVAAARDQQAQAQNGLDQAKALLGQAEALWQTAAGAAASALHELADDAPQRSLWDKIVDAFKAFIDFLVSTVMEWIVAILDVLATLAGFIFPPLGSAIGFLAGGLDILRAAVSGNMAEIGLALAGLALGLVPGGRIAKRIIDLATDVLPGTVRGGAAGAGRGIGAGGGRTVKAPLPTPGITPHRPPVPLDTSVSLDLRKCVTDPVDVATGEMVLSRVDVALPVVERTHVSSYRAGGLFGPTWTSTLDQRLETDARGVCWFAPDGMILVYPAAEPGTAVLPEEGPRMPLTALPDDRAEVRDPATGRVLRFRAGLLESIEEDGARLTVERDEEGLPTVLRHSSGPALSVTTSGGRITALHRADQTMIAGYEYDDGGRLTGARNASGKAEEYGYDEAGRVTSWRDRNGVGYRYTYDASGRCVATDGDNGFLSATFGYDVERRVTRFTDSLGQVRTYELDEWHHTIRETDPLGNTVTSEWDRHHRLLARTDALGGTTRYEYVDDTAAVRQIIRADGSVGPEPVRPEVTGRDMPRDPAAAGAVVAVTGPNGVAEQIRYDDEGNPVERTGAAGQVTRYEYGAFDLITAVVDPVGGRTEYRYDTELRLTGVTDPRGLIWSYGYDGAGRLVEERDFDGRVLGFTYDGAGRLVASANGLGEVREYVRDPLGAVVASGTATYTYDWAGRLMSASDGDSSLVIERDEHGRVVAQTTDGGRMTFSYDADGRAVHRRTPSGAHSVWRFDASGPSSLTAGGHRTDFRHDGAGREVERRVDGVPVLGQAFDGRWLSEQHLAGAARRRFERRADGEVLRVLDESIGITEYALDPAGRVLAVTGPDVHERYRYDVAGNLVATSVPGAATSGDFAYDGNLVSTAGQVMYDHDGQGRTTTRCVAGATWTYTWDTLDRLTGVRTPDGEHWRYAYDPLGRRASKLRLDGDRVVERVDFVWDGAVLVEQVHTGADGRRQVTTWDHHPVTGHPVAQSAPGEFLSIVTDAVGTPTELLGTDGAPVWRRRASLWGQPLTGAEADATPLRFPGQYFDAETGLHYNVFRYYDPVTGRYLSQDPLGLAPAPNPVAYVPNPLSAADPLGLAPTGNCSDAAGAGGIPARPDPGDIGTLDTIRSDRSPTPDRGEGSSTGTAAAPPRSPSPEPESDIADFTPPHPALTQPWRPNPDRPGMLFHGSQAPPEEIFQNGLKSSANFGGTRPHYDLFQHIHNARGSGFVSTTGNFNVGVQFVREVAGDLVTVDKQTFVKREGYIYHVEPPADTPFIHVPSQNLPETLERFRYQDEWAALDGIPGEYISGATTVSGYYKPSVVNDKLVIELPPNKGAGKDKGPKMGFIPNPNFRPGTAP